MHSHSSSREALLAPGPEGIVKQIRIGPAESRLARGIDTATAELLKQQRPDGHWVFELEADATIAAEYVVLQHFLGESKPPHEAEIATYLRRLQCPHGGWALFPGGEFNTDSRSHACPS